VKKLTLAIAVLSLAACTKTPLPAEPTVYQDALIILNEGAFTGGTATIDAIGGNMDTVVQSAFSSENGFALGNIGQHMILADSLLAVSVNNAAVVRGISRQSMLERWSTLLAGPRYLAKSGNGLIVTTWSSDYIKILDIYSGQLLDSINVFGVSEQIHADGDVVYVGLNGGFGNDNRVAVVDLATKNVDTLLVGDKPNSFVQIGSAVYVLCSGYEDWSGSASTPASLWKIENGLATQVLAAPSSTDHAIALKTDGTDLYFLNASYSGAVVKTSMNPAVWPTTPLTKAGGYNLDLINDVLYVHDAKDYASAGKIYQYDLTGILLDSIDAGIIPRQVITN
jgi:hypothetical protein